MGKWLDLARSMDSPCDNSDITDNSPPNVTNVTNVTGEAPPDIAAGARRLALRGPRCGIPLPVWRRFAADALWLVEHGVASDALARGWTAIDLFGASADDQWQSLAAWISGRRGDHGRACILLTEHRGDRSLPYAVLVNNGSHSWHYPDPPPDDARLAWEL